MHKELEQPSAIADLVDDSQAERNAMETPAPVMQDIDEQLEQPSAIAEVDTAMINEQWLAPLRAEPEEGEDDDHEEQEDPIREAVLQTDPTDIGRTTDLIVKSESRHPLQDPAVWSHLLPGTSSRSPPAWFPGAYSRYPQVHSLLTGARSHCRNPFISAYTAFITYFSTTVDVVQAVKAHVTEEAQAVKAHVTQEAQAVKSHIDSALEARFGPMHSEDAPLNVAQLKLQQQAIATQIATVRHLEKMKKEEDKTKAAAEKQKKAEDKTKAAAERPPKRARKSQ